MDEKARDELINNAINRLSELTGEDFHGYRSEVWNVLSSLLSEKEKEIQELKKLIRLFGQKEYFMIFDTSLSDDQHNKFHKICLEINMEGNDET